MPGGWLGTEDGDYQAYTPRKGDILEIRVVDEAGGDQCTLLVAVVSRQECAGPGEAFSGFILGASDEYYRYWIAEGEGKDAREDGLYHLCFKSIEECRTWRGRKEVVHSDKFRLVTPTDIREGRVGWLKQRAVRAEVVGQLARYETKFPPQRVRKRLKPGEAKDADAAEKDKAGESVSEEEDDTSSSSSAEETALLKKMTRLQAELKAAEKLVEDKKGVKAKRKAMKKAMKAKDSKVTKKKDKGREASPLAEGEKAKGDRKDKKVKKKDKGSPDSRGRNKKRRRGSSDSDGSKAVKKKKKKLKKDARGKERSSASAEDEVESGEALFRSGERKKKTKDRRVSEWGALAEGYP